jgi:hypothetical protein
MIGRNETESDQTKGLLDIPADTSNRLNLIGRSYSPDYNRTVVEENNFVGLDLDYRFDRDCAQHFLPQRSVPLRAAQHSVVLVVHWLSPRLPPHHGHRGQNQLR